MAAAPALLLLLFFLSPCCRGAQAKEREREPECKTHNLDILMAAAAARTPRSKRRKRDCAPKQLYCAVISQTTHMDFDFFHMGGLGFSASAYRLNPNGAFSYGGKKREKGSFFRIYSTFMVSLTSVWLESQETTEL